MKNLLKNYRFLAGLLSIFISVFLVAVFVYAATTIGTNIETAGTLNVTGLATFDHATTTSATTTDYLYVGTDITELSGWDFSGGDLIVSGAAHFAAKATSTTAFAVGAGTISNLDMVGGDLYVQGDAEIDGTLYITTDLTVTNKATSTVAFAVGAGTISLDMAGGDLYVLDDVEIDSDLTVGGNATTTGYIYLPMVHFQQGVTTSTNPNTGECFMPANQFKCYDGSNWQCMDGNTCN